MYTCKQCALRSAASKNRLVQIELNNAMFGQQLGALTMAVYSAKNETEDLLCRVKRSGQLEQRGVPAW
ncbi:MAG TPA: hypothetical protein DDY14_02680 [Chromatiaceae bacterium]|nr:hypothetical protein [Chromatiaceae bacterium]